LILHHGKYCYSRKYAWAPVLIELIGAVSLLYSSLLLIQEARFAVASTLGEMASVRETVQRLQNRS
jgi:hypothetical protein